MKKQSKELDLVVLGEAGKVAKHKVLLEELHETYKSKNADYGDSFSRSFEKYGPIAPMVRISDKFNRLDNLISDMELNKQLSKQLSKQQVKSESLRDTAMDMANYLLMFVMELEQSEQ